MKRKLVKQGNNALTLTLPKKWLDKYNLKPGNVVFIKDIENELIIAAKPVNTQKKETIDLDKYKDIIPKYIHSLYRQGVTEIIVKFSDLNLLNIVQKTISENIIGYEIIEQEKNKAIIRNIAEINEGNFDQTFRRLFRINESMFNSIDDIKSLIHLESTNNKLSNYCRRYISNKLYEGQLALLTYLVVETQERLADEILFLVKLSKDLTNIEKEYITKANKFYKLCHEIYYSQDPHKLSSSAIKYKNTIAELLNSKCSETVKHYLSNIFYYIGLILSYKLQLLFVK
jgi:phosphate uptake regulator